MPDSPSLSSDIWLSDMLGIPAFSVFGGPGELPSVPAPCFLYAKVGDTEAEEARAQWLSDIGFCQVSTTVTYEKSIAAGKAGPDAAICRAALPDDEKAVAAIARSAFSTDRFHRDPFIGDDVADRIKEAWARNFFRRRRGDGMIVAIGDDGAVAGFLQILRPDMHTHVIDLIAVNKMYRGRGIARAMINALESHGRVGDRILVGTQDDNAPSKSLYMSSGFALGRTQHIFHRSDT